MGDTNESKDGASMDEAAKRAKIMAIMQDKTLTDAQRAQQIQRLHCGSKWLQNVAEDEKQESGILDTLSKQMQEELTCGICTRLVVRPVSLPCQHNMCLECLKGMRMKMQSLSCPYDRTKITPSFVDAARINMTIVETVRELRAKAGGDKSKVVKARVHQVAVEEDDRPEQAFVTERAVRKGMANAASGRLKMSCPASHFGPIGLEFDETEKRGVVVGDTYDNRMTCRMYNVHLPHVAGISGQGDLGAQSVVLSGGYEDDVDEGEYFLYTGSGGKDLSGNKRNGAHNGDQEFTRYNLALKASCEKGLPVRVVRSCKEKRSAYAPKIPERPKKASKSAEKAKGEGSKKRKSCAVAAEEEEGDEEEEEEESEAEGSEGEESEGGEEEASADEAGRKVATAIAKLPVRYDGIYRILACWRVTGKAGYLVCRYLFVRCDNAPAPWTSDESGDKPRLEIPPLADAEMKKAKKSEITRMGATPYWDYDPVLEEWGWTRPMPVPSKTGTSKSSVKKKEKPLEEELKVAERDLLKEKKKLIELHGCGLCQKVAVAPVVTPCNHRFCKECLLGATKDSEDQVRHNARPKRNSSQRLPCPYASCNKDLKGFLTAPLQTNNVMASLAKAAEDKVQLKEDKVAELKAKVAGENPTPAGETPALATDAVDAHTSGDQAATGAAGPSFTDGTAPAGEKHPVVASPSAAADKKQTDKATTDDVDMVELGSPELPPTAPSGGVGTKGARTPTDEESDEDLAAVGSAGVSADARETGRWDADAAVLQARFPDFEVALISGLLEDQGGDVQEVEAYLKKLQRSLKQPKSPTSKQATAGRGSKGGRGRGRGGAAPKTAAVKAESKNGSDEEMEVDEKSDQEPVAKTKTGARKATANPARASKRLKTAA